MEFLLDVLFPKRCIGCRHFGSYICRHCSSKIIPIPYAICPECTQPSIGGIVHQRCKGKYTLDGLTVAFRYEGIVKKLLKQLKYAPWFTDVTKTIVHLASKQNSSLAFQQFIATKPFIVPVPLHWMKQWARGYNQSTLLSNKYSRVFNLSTAEVLQRRKKTKPQYGLGKEERIQNMNDAFSIKPNSVVAGRTVLLVDDIWTTGTTLRACAKVLKRNGVTSVWALTIAR